MRDTVRASLLGEPVDSDRVELAPRTLKALTCADVDLDALATTTADRLMMLRGFGSKSLLDVATFLAGQGAVLAGIEDHLDPVTVLDVRERAVAVRPLDMDGGR